MDNQDKPNSLPEKVVRRHAIMLDELLPEITRLVIAEGRPADTLLNQHLRMHKELGSRDRRFLSQAVFCYFRWYGWTVNQLHLPPAEACLVGTALETTAFDDSFQYLATRCKLPCSIEPMGGKTLEEKRAILNEGFMDAPGFRPLELADLVFPDFGNALDPAMVDRCIAEFQQRPPTWLRLRGDPAPVIQALAEHQVACAMHDRVATAVSLDGGTSLPHLLAPHAAQFVVQDIASQCVGLVCAPQKGGDWWDCCAGAGGKALHLMDLMQQDGSVLATDVRAPALKELKKRARRYGIRGIRTQPYNAVHDEPFRKTFDGVLVDAPCSGWGTWSRNPDARWRNSIRDVVQCATRQVKILNNAAWCVKPGGTLVYAVCTFTRPETEEVVMNFLDQNPAFQPEPFVNPLTGATTAGTLQIWPDTAHGDAMFIARFIRIAE